MIFIGKKKKVLGNHEDELKKIIIKNYKGLISKSSIGILSIFYIKKTKSKELILQYSELSCSLLIDFYLIDFIFYDYLSRS